MFHHVKYGIWDISKCGSVSPFIGLMTLKRSKLNHNGIKNIFVGYAKISKTYRLLDLNSNVIVESKDVKFVKNKFWKDNSSNAKSVPSTFDKCRSWIFH